VHASIGWLHDCHCFCKHVKSSFIWWLSMHQQSLLYELSNPGVKHTCTKMASLKPIWYVFTNRCVPLTLFKLQTQSSFVYDANIKWMCVLIQVFYQMFCWIIMGCLHALKNKQTLGNLASYPTFTKVFSVMFWNAGIALWALNTRAIFPYRCL